MRDITIREKMKAAIVKQAYFFKEDSELGLEKFISIICLRLEHQERVLKDIVFDWDETIDGMYFVKEGIVTLLEKAPPYITLNDRLEGRRIENAEGAKPIELPISKSLEPEVCYREIGIRQVGQVIGEEYFYLKQPTSYRAVVSSASASLLILKFKDVDFNLKSYEVFRYGTLK